MYGASPGIFKSLIAVTIVAEGYSVEENSLYVAYIKVVDGQTFYRAGLLSDEEVFNDNGYEINIVNEL